MPRTGSWSTWTVGLTLCAVIASSNTPAAADARAPGSRLLPDGGAVSAPDDAPGFSHSLPGEADSGLTGPATGSATEAPRPGKAPSGSAVFGGSGMGAGPLANLVAPQMAPQNGLPQAHYAAPIRTPDGYIDVNATLNGIVVRGSRLYQYLLYPRSGFDSAKDWARLPAFLRAARLRGVSVQVVLTPPASTSSDRRPCSADQLLPYRGRYDDWMIQIGKLARAHRNLAAVVMDDYAYSATNRPAAECRTFKPGTITRWNQILTHQAGRSLKVLPVLYLMDVVGRYATYASIKREASTVVWPFVSIGTPDMRAQYKAMKARFPAMRIYVMVYAAPYKGKIPTQKTVARELSTAKALKPAAVVIYHQLLT